MKEHPIIFSGPMVKAILEGRKTQTRRVIKPQPPTNYGGLTMVSGNLWSAYDSRARCFEARCPYGQVGDRLWLRETHYYIQTNTPTPKVVYRADYGDPTAISSWRPSIHMPRWASRITLEITGVKVERIQDITPRNAGAEGYPDSSELEELLNGPMLHAACKRSTDWFKELWDTIHGYGHWEWHTNDQGVRDKYWFDPVASWDVNPWVWALTFKVANA